MQSRITTVVRGVSLGLACACVVWAYFAARASNFITVFIAFGYAQALLLSLLMTFRTAAVSPQVSYSDTGTVLKPDEHVEKTLRYVMTVGTVSTCLCFVAWWPFDILYLPFFADGVGQIIPIASGGIALGFLWTWWRHSRLGAFGVLTLTPQGFQFSTIFGSRQGNWDDVAKIWSEIPGKKKFCNALVFDMKNGRSLRFEASGALTPEGTALFHLVRIYWQSPEHRAELTDGRALQRLQRQQGDSASGQS